MNALRLTWQALQYFWLALPIVLAAVMAALARHHAHLRRKYRALLKEKEVIFAFVHDVGEVFAESETVDLDTLLEKVLLYGMRTTHAGAGAIYLLEPDREHLRARAVSGLFPPMGGSTDARAELALSKAQHVNRLVRNRRVRKGEGLLGEVAEFGTPLLVEDAERDPRIPQYESDFLRVHSLIAVPLRFHHETLGILVVVNRTDGSPFIESDQNLLQALADQASVSTHYTQLRDDLDAKKRMDHDLSIARRIQTLLLPGEIPHVPGFELAAFNVPALMVGGDYYDVVRIDQDHVGVAIADVSGKGIGGALLMSVCRSTLRARAPGQLSPAAVLRELSRELHQDLAEDMFVTALYLVLNHRTREVRHARAGHEPLVLCRGGQVQEMDAPGVAIGMVPPKVFDQAIQDRTLKLEAGDILTAYTDGITEAMSPSGEEWGSDRLFQAIQAASETGAQQTVDSVKEHVMRFTGDAPPYDDMTLVTIKVNAIPPR